ncbi:MAG TPA: hypothetical protein VM490_23880 [Armatimonadaceae bacterium]|nr:hypothetical protein [Armatimonadaceae bacterium]
MSATPGTTILLLADDLMFPSRIREGLRPLGHSLRTVGDGASLAAALRDAKPSAVLVNLTARRYDPAAIIASLKADPGTKDIPVLAFAGHVEADKHAAARAAGADMVVANSSVSLHLAALLPRLLSGQPAGELGEDASHDH